MATEALVCTPEDLIPLAKCMKCIPVGMQKEVLIYLLATMAGVSTDPATLIYEARCMKCIPAGMQDEVITYLLCQLTRATLPA